MGLSGVVCCVFATNGGANAPADAAVPQYARRALAIQAFQTKKTLAALPREGSQSE